MKDRREKIEKRIEMNMSMAEKIEEKRKNDFLDKQEHFERARMAHLMQQDQDRYVLTFRLYHYSTLFIVHLFLLFMLSIDYFKLFVICYYSFLY